MKKEQQTTLTGKEIINQPNLGYLRYSMFKILKEFYMDYSSTGMSLVELRRKLRLEMSRNTINLAIIDLREQNMISLYARNVGPTKRRKYYKITEKGTLFWEEQNKR